MTHNTGYNERMKYKQHDRNKHTSRNYARSCNNHGECPYCKGNRLHSVEKEIDRMDDIEEYYEEMKLEMEMY